METELDKALAKLRKVREENAKEWKRVQPIFESFTKTVSALTEAAKYDEDDTRRGVALRGLMRPPAVLTAQLFKKHD